MSEAFKYSEELLMATELAKKVGDYLKSQKPSVEGVVDVQGREVKTTYDEEAHQICMQFLKEHSVFPVLSEEDASSHILFQNNETLWIVDPLDGTFNYIHGIPFCCVSIALWKNRKPILGVVYDFSREELFQSDGGSTLLNGDRIFAKGPNKVIESVVASGLPSFSSFETGDLERFVRYLQSFKKVRFFGSAALSISWIACGRVHVYAEKSIRLWDVAAGLPIVKASGGSFDMTSAVLNEKGLVMDVNAAANEKVLAEMRNDFE